MKAWMGNLSRRVREKGWDKVNERTPIILLFFFPPHLSRKYR